MFCLIILLLSAFSNKLYFPVGKKKTEKNKKEVTILCSSISDWSLHLEIVLCLTRIGLYLSLLRLDARTDCLKSS